MRHANHRHLPGLLRLFAGVDTRRPASWIALVIGAWAGWWCAASAADGLTGAGIIAMLSAAVAAVAAVGDLPLDLCPPAAHGSRRGLVFLWVGERVAWPLGGVMLGMLAAGMAAASLPTLAIAAIGPLLAAVTVAVSRLAGAKAADAASLTLLVAAASAAAGFAIGTNAVLVAAGATTAWLLLGGLAWACSRPLPGTADPVSTEANRALPSGGADVLHLEALPANGPLRQTLTGMAMVAALVAMAGWLVVETAPGQGDGQARQGSNAAHVDHATVAWALFSAAWFIGLAVPQSLLLDGVAGAVGWERLFRTTARANRLSTKYSRLFSSPPLGGVRFAGGVAVVQAAILGWPALVCAVLSLPTPARAGPPLGIVVGLAVAAAAVAACAAMGAALRCSRETTFAAVLAVAVGVFTIAVVSTGFRQDTATVSPSLSSLAPWLVPRLRGG
jgi:hypothetical protein